MKKNSLLILLILFFHQVGISQGVKFDRTEIIISNIKEYNIHKMIYKFTNISKEAIEVSIIPKTYLTNPIINKNKFEPGEVGVVTLEFYPQKTGSFHEFVSFKVDGKLVTQLSYSGYISSFSNEYKSIIQNKQLSSEKDIVFMIVDASNYEYIPNAKISIYNLKTDKTYIGTTDVNGILKDKLPDGQYAITSMIEGYDQEIVGTQVEPRRNAALILLKKTGIKPLELYQSKLKNKISTNVINNSKDYKIEPVRLPVKEEPVAKIIPKPIIDTVIPIQKIVEPVIDTFRNLNIVMLLDISLSMNKNDRIGILKKSIQYIVKNFNQNDKMGIITFNDTTNIIYPLSKIDDKETVIRLIDSIKTSGKTNGVESITVAIEELNKKKDNDAINMIILSTDGKITPDPNDFRLIYDKVDSLRNEGSYFSTISFGANAYDDRLMMRLAEIGGGIFYNYKTEGNISDNILMDKIYENITRKK